MAVSLPPSLEQARVRGLPSAAYYIPDFLTHDEEGFILAKIAAAPKPRWKQLTRRRLQAWPSELFQNALLDAPLPPWLENTVVPRLLSLPLSEASPQHIFAQSPHARPNHVLVNEYPPGDGAAYWPIVCTVSLGASLCLDLYRSKHDGSLDSAPVWRILQEPRSLLITAESLYTDFFHGIADIDEDVSLSAERVANWSLLGDPKAYAHGRNARGNRTSLTYRDVVSVSKVGNKLGIFTRR